MINRCLSIRTKFWKDTLTLECIIHHTYVRLKRFWFWMLLRNFLIFHQTKDFQLPIMDWLSSHSDMMKLPSLKGQCSLSNFSHSRRMVTLLNSSNNRKSVRILSQQFDCKRASKLKLWLDNWLVAMVQSFKFEIALSLLNVRTKKWLAKLLINISTIYRRDLRRDRE